MTADNEVMAPFPLGGIALLAAAAAGVQGNDGVCHENDDTRQLDCGLYMAPSSIPNAGYGLYTARPLQENETIHPLDLAIHIVDIYEQVDYQESIDNMTLPEWLIHRYRWSPDGSGMYEATDVSQIIGGIGAMPNNHPGFTNIRKVGALREQDADRSLPQAGAFTKHKDLAFAASQDIPAGQELSIYYGLGYFLSNNMPTSLDFKRADTVLHILDRVCDSKFDTQECQELWQVIRNDKNATKETVCGNKLLDEDACAGLWRHLRKSKKTSAQTNPLVVSALPETLENVMEARDQGCAWHFAPNVTRTIEWLQENGICLDHIQAKTKSTIPQAGSGAFAKRSLPKGSLVAPAPVIHMHRGHVDLLFADQGQVLWHGHQLLLNYLYGHPSTSLLFFPYSPVANFINHSPEPNVELRWSSRMSHPEWMNRATDEVLAESSKSGLMMEIVAVRDIQVDDEILLDYGREWEAAWKNHVENWQPPLTSKTLHPVEDYWNQTKLPTFDDLGSIEIEPLARNVMTVCWVYDKEFEGLDEEYTWPQSTKTDDLSMTHPCTLLSRNEVNGTFEYTANVTTEKREYRVTVMHRRGIDVVGRPYTSNQFLRQSFRHEIHLPDDMIPEIWKDREVVKDGLRDTSPGSLLNDYTIPVLTEAEQVITPYPESVFIGCYRGSLPDKFGVEKQWEYTSGMYDIATNVSRCDILERHGDDEAIADSIRPAIQNYTVRAWSGKGDSWILTDVPRRAIEFFHAHSTSEISLLDGIVLDPRPVSLGVES